MKRLVIIIAICLLAACSQAKDSDYVQVTQWQVDTIQTRTQLELHLNSAYVFGADGLEPGDPGDCSGKIRAILMAAGIRLQRLPVRLIAKAADGWKFPIIAYKEGRPCALVVMTLQKHRKNGHIGMLITIVQNGKARMAHASSTWGFIAVDIDPKRKNYFYPRITQIRQVDSRQ